MDGTIRWGFLGAARFAASTMVHAVQSASHCELVTLATRTPEKANAILSAAGSDLKVYTDYNDLITAEDIDAVYIPLANHLHVPWAIKAMEAGKHVLVEKPLGMSVAEVDQVIAARDRAGVCCAEGFMVCHHPQWTFVRDQMSAGRIGALQHVDGRFLTPIIDPTNYRAKASFGGGALRDLGVYPIATARFATGLEPSIDSVQITSVGDIDATTRVHGRLGAASMDFTCSMTMFPQQRMEFVGENGIIRVVTPFNPDPAEPAIVEVETQNGVEEISIQKTNQYVLQFEAFARWITSGSEYPCSLDFSRGNQAAVDAVAMALPVDTPESESTIFN